MTTNIHLRIAEQEDLSFLHRLFNDPKVMDFWFSEPYMSMESLKEQVQGEKNQSRHFVITNDEDEQIGLVGFYFLDQRHRHAEFAIALDPSQQGYGYGTKATELALDYAFNVLNLRKVYLIVVAINEKACHIYEKVGFRKEGTLQEHYYINGAYYDAIIMCMFQNEYVREGL